MDHIRLIASDMDATLLDERSQLPPDFAETIRALAGQGILFAAASGRPLFLITAAATGWLGMRIATVSSPAQTASATLGPFGIIMVSGPGQNAWANL